MACIGICVLTFILEYSSEESEYNNKRTNNYIEKFIGLLQSEESFEVKDVFTDFDFDKGYVFIDSYNDGKTFTKLYALSLNIDDVEGSDTDYYRRIIFVDKAGNFVYEFRYAMNKIFPKEEGMIIYPNTKIQKCEVLVKDAVGFEFVDVDEQDYYIRKDAEALPKPN